MIKYKTGGSISHSRIDIAAVEVISESPNFVTLPWLERTRREAKAGDYHRYHDSWDEAHNYLLDRAQLALTRAEIQLKTARENLAAVKAMEQQK